MDKDYLQKLFINEVKGSGCYSSIISKLTASGKIGSETLAPGVVSYPWSYYQEKLTAQDAINADGVLLVKLLDRPIEKSEVQSITMILEGEVFPLSANDFALNNMGENVWAAILVDGDPMPTVVVAVEDATLGSAAVPKGTYGMVMSMDGSINADGSNCIYVTEINGVLTETIHPIDPKFLPGAVVPVVELTTEPAAEGATLTAEESAMMEEVFATGLPFVLKCTFDTSIISVMCSMLNMGGMMVGYVGSIGDNTKIFVNKMEGVWIIRYTE